MNKQILDKLMKLNITYKKGPRELIKIDKEGVLFNQALHYIYSPSGSGKSFISAFIASQTEKEVIYFDMEHNPKSFYSYCEAQNVSVANVTDETAVIEELLHTELDFSTALFIFDSFSMFLEEASENNNATDTSRIVKAIHNLCVEKGATVIIIDHATELPSSSENNRRFKIEGNKSGKMKPVEIMYRLEPLDWEKPKDGATLIVEKSRTDDLYIGETFIVDSFRKTISPTDSEVSNEAPK